MSIYYSLKHNKVDCICFLPANRFFMKKVFLFFLGSILIINSINAKELTGRPNPTFSYSIAWGLIKSKNYNKAENKLKPVKSSATKVEYTKDKKSKSIFWGAIQWSRN